MPVEIALGFEHDQQQYSSPVDEHINFVISSRLERFKH